MTGNKLVKEEKGKKRKPVGKNDEEEESGDSGDEEESPEKPTVDGLCKHFPLSSDVVVPSLNNHSVANIRERYSTKSSIVCPLENPPTVCPKDNLLHF